HGEHPYGNDDPGRNLGHTCKVGSYKPNGFGLYDMHGNVWEWCADWYGKGYYKVSPLRDPPGRSEGTDRVIRGGSWRSVGRDCRPALGYGAGPADQSPNRGFRVALFPPGGSARRVVET